jgi:hypothetical protein
MHGRFAFGLPGGLRRRIILDEDCATVRKGVAEREASFLRVDRRAIFDHPRSPYGSLLALARCELGDIAPAFWQRTGTRRGLPSESPSSTPKTVGTSS